jgi:hypothetical protein
MTRSGESRSACLEMLPCDLSNRSGTMRIETFQPIMIDWNFFTPALVLSILQIHPYTI